MQDQTPETDKAVSLTAEIVVAYLTKNNVAAGSIPDLISTVHGALTSLGKPQVVPEPTLTPAVPIKKSITPDYIISLEDGRRYKTLKRHLSARGLTPDQYRAKWGLARDYPVVAPNYAKLRSEQALTRGLGRKRQAEPEQAPEPDAGPARNARRNAASGASAVARTPVDPET